MDIIINSNGKINQIPQEKEAATPTLPIDFEDGSVDAILAQMSDDNKSEDRPLAEQLLDEVERNKQDILRLSQEPIRFDKLHYEIFKDAVTQLSKKANFNDAETIQHLMDLGFDRSEITPEKADLTRLTWDEDEDGNTLPTLHNTLLKYASDVAKQEVIRRDRLEGQPIEKQITLMAKVPLALINEKGLFSKGSTEVSPYSGRNKFGYVRTLLETKVPDKWIIDGKTNLTYFEYKVAMMIITLWHHGHRCFVAATIYKLITLDKDANPSPYMEALIRSIIEDTLMEIKVTIDASSEIRAITGNYQDEYREVRRPLFNLRIVDVKVNGKRTRAYYFLEPPVMYEYATLYEKGKKKGKKEDATGLFMTSSKKEVQFNTQMISFTENTISGSYFLTMEFYRMKTKKGYKKSDQSNTFTLKEYYDAIGIDPGKVSRESLMKVRASLDVLLDYYKSIKTIEGFKYIREGNHITKVKIILKEFTPSKGKTTPLKKK